MALAARQQIVGGSGAPTIKVGGGDAQQLAAAARLPAQSSTTAFEQLKPIAFSPTIHA